MNESLDFKERRPATRDPRMYREVTRNIKEPLNKFDFIKKLLKLEGKIFLSLTILRIQTRMSKIKKKVSLTEPS
ncbi:hypothetical protein CH375_04775 [Leptospira ellisii]|nr:hypothetical protein CH375_04775 [Leptospira ellisii]